MPRKRPSIARRNKAKELMKDPVFLAKFLKSHPAGPTKRRLTKLLTKLRKSKISRRRRRRTTRH